MGIELNGHQIFVEWTLNLFFYFLNFFLNFVSLAVYLRYVNMEFRQLKKLVEPSIAQHATHKRKILKAWALSIATLPFWSCATDLQRRLFYFAWNLFGQLNVFVSNDMELLLFKIGTYL